MCRDNLEENKCARKIIKINGDGYLCFVKKDSDSYMYELVNINNGLVELLTPKEFNKKNAVELFDYSNIERPLREVALLLHKIKK